MSKTERQNQSVAITLSGDDWGQILKALKYGVTKLEAVGATTVAAKWRRVAILLSQAMGTWQEIAVKKAHGEADSR